MHVLNVNMSLDPVKGGGTVERSLQINRHLISAGINSLIVATDAGVTKYGCITTTNSLEKFELLPCMIRRFYVPYPSLSKLRKLVVEADVINLMGHWTVMNAIVFLMAKKYNKPYTFCPAGGLLALGRSKLMKRFYNYIVGMNIVKGASALIAIAPNELEQFEKYGIAKDRVTLIPNGINPHEYEDTDSGKFRTVYSIGKQPYILFIGRLNWIKGPDMLLQAYAESYCCERDIHLVIAGPDDGMLSILKRMTKDLKIERYVHFVGHLSGSDKSQAIHGASLVVVPSRLEAMSIVVLEAGVCGVPVLLTNQCGFNDVAKVSGGMVVEASVLGLTDGISYLMNDSIKLADYGQNLKAHVLNNYLWSAIVKRYLKLLSVLCTVAA